MASRDYKKRAPARRAPANRKGGGVPGWLWLVTGLAAGLLVAFLIWLGKLDIPQPATKTATTVTAPAPSKPATQDTRSVKQETPPPAPSAEVKEERKGVAFDFYTLLPEMEVQVPEPEPAAPGLPPPPVTTPGSYVLQVGAFRTMKDADTRKAELALLGIVSHIQEVTVDGNRIYRVRIGPITHTDRLDQLRTTLKQNDIPFMLLREKS